jgi:hypothetical protein
LVDQFQVDCHRFSYFAPSDGRLHNLIYTLAHALRGGVPRESADHLSHADLSRCTGPLKP